MDASQQKTGIIYCRVSSLEQVDGTSLESQERICREYAKREEIEIIADPFIERGESAKTADRTEFNKAIVLCSNKKKRVNYFIVYKVDRFMRNQDEHGVIRANLKRYGTELRSATEPINETPVGRLTEGVISSYAEFDNSIRSERSKGGMVEKVKQGFWSWKAPLGYKRLMKGGNLVPDDEIAPYIRTAFEEYAKGIHSYRSLALHLKERGFRTREGKNPSAQLMEKMIHNPLYYGLIRAFGSEFQGVFPPLISEDLYWKCQTKLKSKFYSGKRQSENPNFPLRKFATCSLCEGSITGSASTNHSGRKYSYYHHHRQNCPLASFIPKETLEQNFVEFLQGVSPKIRSEKLFRAVILDVWQSKYKKLDSDNARIRREVEVLESERQKIFGLHRSGHYTAEEFLEQKDLINLKIHEKKNLLDDKRVEEFNMDEALEYCFNLIRRSGRTWKSLEKVPAYRLRFQKSIFPEKITFDGKKFGTKKISMIYAINQGSVPEKSQLVTLRGVEPRLQR